MNKRCFKLGSVLATCTIMLMQSFTTNAQTISTVAGTGSTTFGGDGGPATAGSIRYPYHAIFDATGNMYIADWGNNRIRKVNVSGDISTIAGTGVPTYGGDGAAATAAYLNQPAAIAIDASGNIYFSDNGNTRIRKIDGSGTISTFAGSGSAGYSGDGGAATAAKIADPRGIAFDAAGNLYIAEASNHVIRKVSTTGIISTVAGNHTGGYLGDGGAATAAKLDNPRDVAIDAAGNMYIADNNNHCIRKVSASGTISTIAGVYPALGFSGDGGPATSAQLKYPDGLFVDAAGNIYIGDGGNNRVRKINPAGNIYTIAGNGTYASTGDGGPATAASIKSPLGTCKDAAGNIYVADEAKIRKITPTPLTVTGGSSLCTGNSLTLSASLPDGVWSSSSTTIASVGTSGVVTGLTGGTVNITYTESGTDVIKTITVNPMPAAITGASSVCIAATTPLANTVAGGAWTSSDGTIATVDASGTVTGIAAGVVYITYSISGCYVTSSLTVTTCTPSYIPVNTSNNITIYPNPASEYFTIALPSGTTSVSIINLVGKKIMNIHPGTQSRNIIVPTTDLTPGNYIIKTATGNSIYRNTITIIK